jgi:hypothetical protein
MNNRLFFSIAVAAIAAPSLCFAQASTATGAVGGAAAGAVVGGPVGAVVGGAVGATIGAAAEPPAEVRTYVMGEQIPSVAVREHIVVGEPLPATVEVHRIPKHEKYSYAVVNNRRVIVEPRTRKIIKIYE